MTVSRSVAADGAGRLSVVAVIGPGATEPTAGDGRFPQGDAQLPMSGRKTSVCPALVRGRTGSWISAVNARMFYNGALS
jgi:hypothetical protein